jgi:hypothetical protein
MDLYTKRTMEKLLISFALLSVFTSCGVKKLTPAKGFYFQKGNVCSNQEIADKVEEEQPEEYIEISGLVDGIGSFPLPPVIIDHSINEDSDAALSEDLYFYIEEIPDNGNGLEMEFKHDLVGGQISKLTFETLTESSKKQTQKTARNSDVDWEMLGLIGFYILLVIVLALALFGTGPWAAAATIIVAIGYAILLIAAIVCIVWFLNFVFFGWL